MSDPICAGKKRCAACGVVKPAIAFSVNRQMPDGVEPHCRTCVRARKEASPSRRKARMESGLRKARRARAFHDFHASY